MPFFPITDVFFRRRVTFSEEAKRVESRSLKSTFSDNLRHLGSRKEIGKFIEKRTPLYFVRML